MDKWFIAISIILPTLLEVIDTSVVNVSLGHIRGSLSAGIDEATWTITAYLVSNAIVIPMTGWLSRVFGRKRYLMASVVLFTVSSFLCGCANSLGMLIFFRILQGIGGGGLQPISQAILLETFPPAQWGMAMAIFGIGVMFGPIIGPMLGGWITDNWSWPWIFYINIPIGIISAIMIMLFIKDPEYIKRQHIKDKVDYWGLALIVVGIGALQVVLDKGQREDWFESSFIIKFSIIAIVALLALVFVELRRKDPILNFRIFKDRTFTSGNIIQFFSFFVLFGSLIILPLFVQELLGYTAFLAGLALAPGGMATLFMMPIIGQLLTRVNPKGILIAGLAIVAYSMFFMAKFTTMVDMHTIMWSRVIMGIGLGMIFVPLTSLAFATIKKEDMGNATSMFSLLRNIAGSVGIAFMTTLLSRRAQFHQFRFSERLDPYNPVYQAKVQAISHMTQGQMPAEGVVYGQLMKQASLFSFTDSFYFSAVIMLCVIPVVFLLRRQKGKGGMPMMH